MTEQDRPDVLRHRRERVDGLIDLDPVRLVFIDATWATTNTARTHGRCATCGRQRIGVQHGRWKATAIVGALSMRGMVAPFVPSAAINRRRPCHSDQWRSSRSTFEASGEKVLVPVLRPVDIAVSERRSRHIGPRTGALIEAAGAPLLLLPPCSPGVNPIGNALAEFGALLRKATERIVDGLRAAIGRIAGAVSPTDCANHFGACGHDPDC